MTAGQEGYGAPRAEPPRPARRLPGIIALAVIALLGFGVGVAAFAGVFNGAKPESEAAPETTTQTTPTPLPTPTPTPEPAPLPDPEIDIPEVHQMAYTPVWDPPDQGQYVWQIVDPAYGYPETGGTRYILAHSCETQECVGDSFRTLEAGDTLTFLGQTYQVQESREIMKADIAAQDIWTHDPNRLVIITCIIDTTWDQSNRNDVIVATRVP